MPKKPVIIPMLCLVCGANYGDTVQTPVVYCRHCASKVAAIEIQRYQIERDAAPYREHAAKVDAEGNPTDPSAAAHVANAEAQLAALRLPEPTPQRAPIGPTIEFRKLACGTCNRPLGHAKVARPTDPSPTVFCDPDCAAEYFASGVADPEGKVRLFG